MAGRHIDGELALQTAVTHKWVTEWISTDLHGPPTGRSLTKTGPPEKQSRKHVPSSELQWKLLPQEVPSGQIWPFEQTFAPVGTTHE